MRPKKPDPIPEPALPDPEDPATIEARRKAQEAILNRSGRRSTILT